MKQFLIALEDIEHATEEFRVFDLSLASAAIAVENLRLRVRQIEEIPFEADSKVPSLQKMTLEEAEKYKIHGPHDADIFSPEDR
jgi:hypothetical protein